VGDELMPGFGALRGLFRKGTPATPCTQKGDVVVVVKRRDTKAVIAKVKVTLAGGGSPSDTQPTDDSGKVKWTERLFGKYLATVAFEGEDARRYEVPKLVKVTVPQSGDTEILVDVIHRKLRVILTDSYDRPIASQAWAFSTPVAKKGKTAEDGLVELDITADHTSAKLSVERPPPHTSQPKHKTAKPSYPPAIEPGDFTDRDRSLVTPPASQLLVDWDLTIVDPEHADWKNEKSLKHRLHNLGFLADSDGDAAMTKAAVETFQAYYRGKKGNGLLADVAGDLKSRHDKP
jgi:hypothetical protein